MSGFDDKTLGASNILTRYAERTKAFSERSRISKKTADIYYGVKVSGLFWGAYGQCGADNHRGRSLCAQELV